MGLVILIVIAVVGGVWEANSADISLNNTDLLQAFVIFRSGDRTPEQEELDLYPDNRESGIFFPYGKNALTNKGKQRSALVGKYLRERYDGLISKLYLPEEIVVRTTDYARTQMTALAALSALYPPPPAQKWNTNLDWQPIPYNTPPSDGDDLLYRYNCPTYLMERDETYELPAIKKSLDSYKGLFSYLSEKTGSEITNAEQVLYLDNLFQTMLNVGVNPPLWAKDVMQQIKEVTRLEYATRFYNTEIIRLASGVLMQSILDTTSAYRQGNTDVPKLYLYSAHENNVAALMAAARVFQAHQPSYGATFSLELRRDRTTGVYGIAAVYAKEAGGPGEVLPIEGCGGELFCEYATFVSIVQDFAWSQADMSIVCNS